MSTDTQTARHELMKIRAWVHSNLGIVFPDEKLDSLERRLEDVMRAAQIDDLPTLFHRLSNDASTELHLQLSQAMATNHTSFFRELPALEALFQSPPPHEPGETLRVWSAACSTGEEPYSVAMLAHEHYPDARERIALLATDISSRALETATAGRYTKSAMQTVSLQRRQRFFQEVDDGYEVGSALRSLCTFRRLNLSVGAWPFRRQFHAIYCRNVLYYFDRDLRARIARRLFNHTVTGGWLFTSVTESLRSMDTPWTFVQPGAYRKDSV